MHGLIFLQFQRFAQKQGCITDWVRLLREAHGVLQVAVDAEADPDVLLLRLEVDVARAARVRVFDQVVRELDDRTIGDGKPGPITLQVMEVFGAALHGRDPRYRSWLYYF